MKILNRVKKLYIQSKLHFSDSMGKAALYSKYYGVNFGDNVRIISKPSFGSEPYLITIGDNVTITDGVKFLTHDGGVGLFRDEYKDINIFSKIIIGSNVFLGANSTILPGVCIGDNVIVGAGSVVTKDVTSNVVVAGVPAKQIRTIEEYKKNCLNKAIYISSNDPGERKVQILSALDIK